jgi:uncharacterized membrane protein YkgB
VLPSRLGNTRAGIVLATDPNRDELSNSVEERSMSLGTILIIVLILMLIGVVPTWPHSRDWGYAPSGVLGTVLIVLIVLFLLGRL